MSHPSAAGKSQTWNDPGTWRVPLRLELRVSLKEIESAFAPQLQVVDV
ncbi:MAG: hypothetical protein L3K19_05515 [Thermoplasmata archaeon]|nr:hypothetical protein [Thermoplasmata archaeon]